MLLPSPPRASAQFRAVEPPATSTSSISVPEPTTSAQSSSIGDLVVAVMRAVGTMFMAAIAALGLMHASQQKPKHLSVGAGAEELSWSLGDTRVQGAANMQTAPIQCSIFPEEVYVVDSVAEWAALSAASHAADAGFFLATIFLSQAAVAPTWPELRRLMRTYGGADVRFVFVEVRDNFYQRHGAAIANTPCTSKSDPRDPFSDWAKMDLDVALARLAVRDHILPIPGLIVGGAGREFEREVSLIELHQRLGDWTYLRTNGLAKQQQAVAQAQQPAHYMVMEHGRLATQIRAQQDQEAPMSPGRRLALAMA